MGRSSRAAASRSTRPSLEVEAEVAGDSAVEVEVVVMEAVEDTTAEKEDAHHMEVVVTVVRGLVAEADTMEVVPVVVVDTEEAVVEDTVEVETGAVAGDKEAEEVVATMLKNRELEVANNALSSALETALVHLQCLVMRALEFRPCPPYILS